MPLSYCLSYSAACLSDENVYEYLINLFGVLKLALLKVSIGAIVIQGLIENILYSTGSLSYDDDDAHSAQEKSMRVYCAYTHSVCLF